jgi:hypothetical protein
MAFEVQTHAQDEPVAATVPPRRLGLESNSKPTHRTSYYMKGNSTKVASQEPIGIVISRGAQPEPGPTVFAYVWGPAPEVSDEPGESKVA